MQRHPKVQNQKKGFTLGKFDPKDLIFVLLKFTSGLWPIQRYTHNLTCWFPIVCFMSFFMFWMSILCCVYLTFCVIYSFLQHHGDHLHCGFMVDSFGNFLCKARCVQFRLQFIWSEYLTWLLGFRTYQEIYILLSMILWKENSTRNWEL